MLHIFTIPLWQNRAEAQALIIAYPAGGCELPPERVQ
jgi:hypothetical protein